jgi:hypothetical protein
LCPATHAGCAVLTKVFSLSRLRGWRWWSKRLLVHYALKWIAWYKAMVKRRKHLQEAFFEEK